MNNVETSFIAHDRTTPTLRGIRRELRDLHDDADRAGRAIDHLAGADGTARIEARTQAMRGLGDAIEHVRGRMMQARPTFDAHERQLDRIERRTKAARLETDKLAVSLTKLGTIRSTAEANVSGVAESLAEVQALRAELAALGRMRATATATATTATTTTNGGGGGFGGGGMRGAGGFGYRGIGAPMLLAAGAVALPGAQALIGGAGALAGSAGAAGLGAAAVYGTGLGVLAAGMGSVIALAGPANKALEEAQKATDAYTESIRLYGIGSTEAKRRKLELDAALQKGPGLHQALRDIRAFNREYAAATAPGQRAFYGMRGDIARAGRQALPGIADTQNRSAQATRGALQSQLDFLTSAEPMGALRQFTDAFVTDLPIAERSLRNIEKTLLRIGVQTLPYLHDLNVAIEDGTAGWEQWSRNEADVSAGIGGLVDDTKRWVDLIGDAGTLLVNIADAGRPAGGGLVDSLDRTLERWNRYIVENPQAVDQWFDRTADGAVRIADSLSDVVRYLDETATALQPVLTGFTSLLSIASSLGLVGTPGVLALAAGAYGGLRNRGGAGGGGAGGLGGAAAGAAAGLGGAAGLRGGRLMYGASRALGAGRGTAALAGAQGVLGGGVGASIVGGAAKRFLPVGVGFGLLDAYGFDGSLGDRARVFGSTLTLGALERPQTGNQILDTAAQRADAFGRSIAGMSGVGAQHAYDAEILRIGGKLVDPSLREGSWLTRPLLNFGGDRRALSDEQRREAEERLKLLARERDELKRLNAEHREDIARRHERESEARGAAFASKIPGVYDAYRSKHSAADAAAMTTRDITRRIGGSRPQGAELVGEAGLQWAREIAKENPAMQREVDRITAAIRRKWRALGVDVQIVNGDILTGSKREWSQIGVAITDPIEVARQKAVAGFTAIQEQAIGSLMAMGYSRSTARQFMRDVQKGRVDGSDPQAAMGAPQNPRGATLDHRGTRSAPGPTVPSNRLPSGGPLIGDGDGMGNRGRSAAAARQRATRRGTPGLMGANPALGVYAQVAAGMGLRVSSGARPGAITSTGGKSYHSSGDALDLAGPPDAMLRFARYAAQNWGSHLEELIYTPMGAGIKNGRPYQFGGSVAANHYDHVHIADTDPSAAGSSPAGPAMAFSADTAGPGMQQISLQPGKSGVPGVAGALADSAMAAYAQALSGRLNEVIGGDMPGMSAPSGKWTAASLAQLWASVNPGIGDPRLMGAIGMAESAGNPRALGIPTSGGRARGLWQIMWPLHASRFPGMDPYVPAQNAKMAGEILQDQGLGAWEAYTRGMHTRFMGDGEGRDAPKVLSSPKRVQLARPSSSGGANVVISPGAVQLSVSAGGMSTAKVHAIVDRRLMEFAQMVRDDLDRSNTEQELMA